MRTYKADFTVIVDVEDDATSEDIADAARRMIKDLEMDPIKTEFLEQKPGYAIPDDHK